jgi:cytochrome c oxidase subunit 2
MKIKVIVESQEAFDAWVANQQLPPVAPQTEQQKAGFTIITTGLCKGCHTLGDSVATQDIGPNLNHLMSRSTFAGAMFPLNEDNLQKWLTDTKAMKPGNDMTVKLDKDELDAVMAYLLTLK